MSAIIHTEGLCKSFDTGSALFSISKHQQKKQVQAVDHVSLDVMEGEILGLIGESGSGKTTLARVLLGLTRADSGIAEIGGKNIVGASGKTLREVRQHMAVVFQDPASNLNPRQTVESSIIRPLLIRGVSRAQARKTAVEAMARVKMDEDYLHSYPHQLSGGQQQRIAIARAISLDPRIMILDEPTSALDISVQAQVLNLLLELQETYGLTYLVITHDMNVIRYIADRIAVMYMGRLVEVGDADRVLANPVHPYTMNLESFVPVLDPEKRREKKEGLFAGDSRDNVLQGCAIQGSCPFASDQCRREVPQMRAFEDGHRAACFRRVDR